MGIKFIHFSDTHLGFSDLDLLDGNGRNIREEDVYDSFTSIVDYILSEKPDFVLHSGDIFHRSSPANKALIIAAQQIQRIAAAGIPFYLIAGNHDYPKSVYTTPIHDLYSLIPECKIFYAEQYEIVKTDDYIIHALPHINSDSKFISEVSKISVIDNSKPNILMMHLSMPSYIMNEYGERVFPAEYNELLKNFSYIALGHWHRFNYLKYFNNAYYSGSIEVFSEKETGYRKGFVKVNIGEKTEVEFIPVKNRLNKNIVITDCSSKEKSQIINEIKEEIKDDDIEGGIFNIQLQELSSVQVYEISKNDLADIFEKALFFSVSKTVKGSDIKYNYDSDTFDLKEQLNEDLKEKFKDPDEYKKVFELTKKLMSEIEEEESDAD